MTMRTLNPSLVNRRYMSVQAESMATAEALPPKTVSRWLMFGSNGAHSVTQFSVASTTCTSIAFESGMRSCRYLCKTGMSITSPGPHGVGSLPGDLRSTERESSGRVARAVDLGRPQPAAALLPDFDLASGHQILDQ